MPSGKYTEGYTKAAQRQKFVRNRDIKLKQSEIAKEEKIQRVMCEGICKRCREKVQWRFKFDKYKPLKNPATCQDCKQKTVTKAYRTLCDACASKRRVCASCCGTEDLNPPKLEAQPEAAVIKPILSERQVKKLRLVDKKAYEERMGDEDEFDMDDDDDDMDEDDDDMDEDDDSDESKSEEEEEDKEEEPMEELQETVFQTVKWNEKKFVNIAATKYSKSRSVEVEVKTSAVVNTSSSSNNV